MKNLTLILLTVLAFASFSFGQDSKPTQALAFTGVYNRENNTLKDINGDAFKYNPAADSIGGGVSWDYHPAKNAFFVGMQAEVTFHNKELEDVVVPIPGGGTIISEGKVSKVAKGAFDYRMGVADRSGVVQPQIAALIGIENGNFGGVSAGPGGLTSARRGSRFRYGGVVGVDLCGGASKRTCLRTAFQLTKKFNTDTTGWDAAVKLGVVFKFGGK